MQLSTPVGGFKVPLVQKIHQLAEHFSLQQTVPKARQVYFNTLAVYAVEFYLKCLGIESVWQASDSWDLLMQTFMDVADLVVPGVGKLECRPVLAGKQSIYIPSDVSSDRIAYIVVQFDSLLKIATILGFVETVRFEEELPFSELQLLKKLPIHIKKVKEAQLLNRKPTRLSLWFEDVFDVNWLSPLSLFNSLAIDATCSARNTELIKENALESFLSRISRGRLIDLGVQMSSHLLALVITITPGENSEIDILARVCPTRSITLPKNLKFTILDETEKVCLEACAREVDNWMQLEFTGKPGESFSIKLALEDASITEHFVI
jgi:hypothetical protein